MHFSRDSLLFWILFFFTICFPNFNSSLIDLKLRMHLSRDPLFNWIFLLEWFKKILSSDCLVWTALSSTLIKAKHVNLFWHSLSWKALDIIKFSTINWSTLEPNSKVLIRSILSKFLASFVYILQLPPQILKKFLKTLISTTIEDIQ